MKCSSFIASYSMEILLLFLFIFVEKTFCLPFVGLCYRWVERKEKTNKFSPRLLPGVRSPLPMGLLGSWSLSLSSCFWGCLFPTPPSLHNPTYPHPRTPAPWEPGPTGTYHTWKANDVTGQGAKSLCELLEKLYTDKVIEWTIWPSSWLSRSFWKWFGQVAKTLDWLSWGKIISSRFKIPETWRNPFLKLKLKIKKMKRGNKRKHHGE